MAGSCEQPLHLIFEDLHQIDSETQAQAKAEEHLAGVKAMYREMDMGFWLEQAVTQLSESR